jgi:hypothetical protein
MSALYVMAVFLIYAGKYLCADRKRDVLPLVWPDNYPRAYA